MMAKRLVMPSKLKNSVSPSQVMVASKVVATTGGKTKKVSKVKAKPIAPKQPNPVVKKRTVKK